MSLKNISLIFAIAVGLFSSAVLTLSKEEYRVNLNSVLEVWADFLHDVENFGSSVTKISTEEEQRIGDGIRREIIYFQQLTGQPLIEKSYISDLGQRLIGNTQRKGLDYRFFVLESEEVNAFSMVGGFVLVTRGMLKFLESEAELAFVLGHEIEHVDLRHCASRLQYEKLGSVLGGNIGIDIVKQCYEASLLAFSEQQELEADTAGIVLAAKSGFYPLGGVTFMQRMKSLEKSEKQSKPGFILEEILPALESSRNRYLLTHPMSDERIENLRMAIFWNMHSWGGKRFRVGEEEYRKAISNPADEVKVIR